MILFDLGSNFHKFVFESVTLQKLHIKNGTNQKDFTLLFFVICWLKLGLDKKSESKKSNQIRFKKVILNSNRIG